MEHFETTTDSCVSVTEGDCEKLARRLNKAFRKITNTIYPLGCYHKKSANGFYFNTSPTGVDCQTNRVCICVSKHGKSNDSHICKNLTLFRGTSIMYVGRGEEVNLPPL